MKQALLLLTAGLILIGGVFIFADRAGLSGDFSKIAVSFMRSDAALTDPKADGTCGPGEFFNEDGKCESEIKDGITDPKPDGTCGPGEFLNENGKCENENKAANEISRTGDENEDTGNLEDAGIDWFFPNDGFVPCGKRGEEGIAIAEPCNVCHAAELGQNILNFLVTTVMPFLAILFSAIGGFLIMTAGGNENRYRNGRDQLVRVVIGILIVLIAWAGINFIMSTFFNEEVTGSWYEFECKVDQEGPVTDFTPSEWQFETEEGSIPIPAGKTPTGDFAVTMSAADAKSYLAQYGIEVSSNAVLTNIRKSTLNEVIALKGLCKCYIIVTGGTGSGHASGTYSHANGYKIDIDDSQAVTQYITTNFTYLGLRKDGAKIYRNPHTGHLHYLEDTHWDILVIPR